MNSRPTKKTTYLWAKIKPELASIGICLAFLAISIVQVSYFRADLRKAMLDGGRRVKFELAPGKRDWLFGSSQLFDRDLESSTGVPFIAGARGQQALLLIELALTHFPAPKPEILPIARKPARLEIYNGSCTACPLSEFRQKARIREATVNIMIRKLDLPIMDLITPKEYSIWQKKLHFTDQPGSQRLNLSQISFFGNQGIQSQEIGVVLLKIQIHSVYAGSSENSAVSIAEIRYADQDARGKLHHWE